MCGRFTLSRPAEVVEHFELSEPVELAPRYNIAPGQEVATVDAAGEGGRRRLAWRRWGLVPPWARDVRVGSRSINARAETAAQRPTFRDAVRARRCLVPADGFYEWDAAAAPRQPYWIARRDGALFAMAALFEQWRGPDGASLASFAILTTEARGALRSLHDRMPAILEPGDYAAWLAPGEPDAAALIAGLRPDADALLTRPVSLRVNDPRVDDPSCLEPGRPGPIQGSLFPA